MTPTSLRRTLSFLLIIGTTLTSYFPSAWARPLLTEESETLGRSTFDAGISVSRRTDEFDSPTVTYKTVMSPVRARIGLRPKLDFGFTLNYLTHRLEKGSNELKGSRTGLFSPEIKYSITPNLGFLAIWHVKRSEASNQELPIARGTDYELIALFKIPVAWKSYLNVGYLRRGDYDTKFGVEGGPLSNVEPGDIFESRASLEIPLKYSVSLLTEAAYYRVGKEMIDSRTIRDSEGDAADVLVGLVWERGGWNIGAGASFGLLDESHTSFDLQRGAGDWTGTLSIAYKLKTKKPGSYE